MGKSFGSRTGKTDFEIVAQLRAVVPKSPRAHRRTSGQRILARMPTRRHHRYHAAFVPLRLGRTRQGLRLSGAVRARSTRSPKQGRTPRLRAQSPSNAAVVGGLRKETRGRRGTGFCVTNQWLPPAEINSNDSFWFVMFLTEPFNLRAFFVFQCWQTVFVILASHARSRVSSRTSAVEKYLVPFGGGCPSGRRSLAATKTGISCDWQFNTHAACSTLSRAGGCPIRARKWRWSSFTRYYFGRENQRYSIASPSRISGSSVHRFSAISSF